MAVPVFSLCLIICPLICFLQRSGSLAANEIKDRHLGHRRDVFSPLFFSLSSLSLSLSVSLPPGPIPTSPSLYSLSTFRVSQFTHNSLLLTFLSAARSPSPLMFHGLYKTECVKRCGKVRGVHLCEGVTLWFIHFSVLILANSTNSVCLFVFIIVFVFWQKDPIDLVNISCHIYQF